MQQSRYKKNYNDSENSEEKLSYKEKSNEACEMAFREIYPKLKEKYCDLSPLYKDIFNNIVPTKENDTRILLQDDFFAVKEWVYVRAKQLLMTRFDCKFNDIYNSNNPYTETDKRLNMAQLITRNFWKFPEF